MLQGCHTYENEIMICNQIKIRVMKKPINFWGIFAIMLIAALSVQNVSGETIRKNEKRKDQQTYFTTYRGKVVDSESGTPLVFATVTVQGSNIATVTNIDGEFVIKVPTENQSKGLVISYIGYNNKVVAFSEMRDNGFRNIIKVIAAPIPLKEITVKPVLPEDIVLRAISNISTNYTDVPNLMTAFYRETVKKSRNYVAIGEAVVEVFKGPYNNDFRLDAIRIYTGRKGADVSRMDTVLFKLQGGPVTSLQLDLIKNPEMILTRESMDFYVYRLANIIMIDDIPHYIIEFEQKPDMKIPLFLGRMYIDTRSYAVKEVEFSLNLEDIEQASSLFIRKKPLGMDVTPEVATYRVTYKESGGKWYFAYSRAEVKFIVNWKRRLFNSNYTTMSEIGITDRTTEEVIKFAGRERVKYSDVFSDKVTAFTDPEFWGDYNVIEPDQSIESAIRRLSRRLRFSDMDDK
jgi:hypothetical protein